MRELILGGARSGKSRLAESRAAQGTQAVTYVATAWAGDGEMAERIDQHRARRPAHWRTVEAPVELAAAVRGECAAGRLVLVDCLTLWLANLLDSPPDWSHRRAELLALLDENPGAVVLVSNEVGLGIVPDNALARKYRDEAGRLHQDLAQLCDRVTFVAAGLPWTLKGEPVAAG